MSTAYEKSMEAVLKEIIRARGISVLTDGKILVAMFRDLSGEKKDQRIIQYFVECGGHTALLESKDLSPTMQKARFNQTVSKMCAETLVSEEVARQVCNAFWSAVYGRPMEKATVLPQQNQKVQQQKIQPVQEIQQDQSARQLQQTQQIKQKTSPVPDCRKIKFYMTAEEYHNGGNIALYYGNGTKQIVNFPPNAKDRQRGLPCEIYPGTGIRSLSELHWYSDGRLQEYVKSGYLSDAFTISLLVIGEFLVWFLMIPIACYEADWIFEAVFQIDLFKNIIFSGIGVPQLVNLFKVVYTPNFQTVGGWLGCAMLVYWFGQIIRSLIRDIKYAIKNRSKVQAEIEWRKSL